MSKVAESLDRQTRINSIDFFRLICAFLVVAIHTHPFEDQSEFLGFIAVQILPRIAVPFFFCVSGLFFFRKLEAGEECVLSTFLRIFKLYVFWSIIYLVKDVVVNVYTRQCLLVDL